MDIPFVFLTAYSDGETVARSKLITPFGYIIKPVENRELQICIDMALYKFKIDKELKETSNYCKQRSRVSVVRSSLLMNPARFRMPTAMPKTCLAEGISLAGNGLSCWDSRQGHRFSI